MSTNPCVRAEGRLRQPPVQQAMAGTRPTEAMQHPSPETDLHYYAPRVDICRWEEMRRGGKGAGSA